jgi:hypothetical protein
MRKDEGVGDAVDRHGGKLTATDGPARHPGLVLLWLAIACAPDPAPPGAADTAASTGGDTHGTAGGTDGGTASGTGGGTGADTDETPAGDCPSAAHVPGVEPATYVDYPVYIDGTDRRFTTIQNGIWGAEEGDEVIVCAGEYHERIDFKGKAITVTSAAGPLLTTLDGQGEGSVVTLRNWEPPESVLEGFTITGGQGDEFHGGGIFIEWGSPTIRHNIVRNNEAGIAGGVYARNAGPTVHNNVIAWNHAREGGGGFTCSACRGTFAYNTLFWNTTDGAGPLMEYFWGAADIVGNVLVSRPEVSQPAVRVTSVREDREFSVSHNLLAPVDQTWAPSSPSGFPTGEAWVRALPAIADPEGGDWTLGAGSPAIDTGPPDATDPDGTRADLGAFGGPNGAWPW